MPAIEIARLASPRTASAEPDMVGDTAVTSGMVLSWSRIFGHWSMERMRWLGRWTIASSNSPGPPRSGRAT